MRRGLERRELSLELGDARGQSMALGLERLAVADAHGHDLGYKLSSRPDVIFTEGFLKNRLVG